MSAAPETDEDVCFGEETASPEGVRKAAGNNPRLFGLPVELHVILGGARLTFKELIELSPSSVLRLDKKVNDPVEIAIGERVFARGALIEDEAEDGGLAVRIVEVIDDGA